MDKRQRSLSATIRTLAGVGGAGMVAAFIIYVTWRILDLSGLPDFVSSLVIGFVAGIVILLFLYVVANLSIWLRRI